MFQIQDYQAVTTIYESQRTTVYRGVRRSDLFAVILKVSRDAYPSVGEITRYKQEYEIVHQLSMTRSVRPIDLIRCNNRLVLVYEDDQGESLKNLMQTASFSLSEKLAIAIKISQALSEIHAHQIIHKDISACNVIVNTASKLVKLIDFGFATKLLRENPCVLNPGIMEGTLRYISPEQTGRMNRAVDYRSDFYSMGAVLYEFFVGQVPFTSDDPLALVHCHLAITPQPMDQLNAQIPPILSDIVLKLMAKTAEDRYQSGWGIESDLENCLAQIEETGQICGFPIGQQDLPSRFSIPEKLYGRAQECDALLDAFARAVGGARELMLIAGYSGVGKSALVREVYRPMGKQRGHVIAGKFDQFQINVPYSAIISAFRELIQQLLCEDQAGLDHWRQCLLAALGDNGAAITDMLPELEQVIGLQPALTALDSGEAKYRFHTVFVNFMRVFCDAAHPLVLFLDDLQWVDAATLTLLAQIFQAEDLGYLFVIGAYRDNEVDASHPLMRTIKKVTDANVTVLTLAPLSSRHLNDMLMDTLHASAPEVDALGQLVIRKTQGNPFFVSQFLNTLYQKELIQFQAPQRDAEGGAIEARWVWDTHAIEREQITDNVVDLLLAKLKAFAPATQHVLKLAASVGNAFDLKTIALINAKSEMQTYQNLLPCIQQEFIVPTSAMQMVTSDGEIDIEQSGLVFASFKFLHDRVQQAAYGLIEAADRPALNLKIGRLLLQETPTEECENRLFAIVDHLNLGRALVSDVGEREVLLQLNLQASAKAKSATAYGAAYNYLLLGKSYLKAHAWSEQYSVTVNLYIEMAEIAYLVGDYEQSESLVEGIWAQASADLDKAQAYALLVTQYTMLGNHAAAIETAAQALSLLQVTLPTAALNAVLDAEVKQFYTLLGERTIESLSALPDMTDPGNRMIMNILMRVHTAAYFDKQTALYGWILARMSNLSLQYGLVPESCKGFASFGNHLSSSECQYQMGYELGTLGLRLSEKYKNASLTCKVSVILLAFLSHWVRPLKRSEAYIDDAYNAGLASGDWQFLGFVLSYGKAINAFCQGKPLTVLAEEVADSIALTTKIKHTLATDKLTGVQLILNHLQDIDGLDEKTFLTDCEKHKSFAAMALFFTYKSLSLYLYGNVQVAYKTVIEATKRADFLHGTAAFAELNVVHSLILAKVYPSLETDQQTHCWRQIRTNQAHMQVWMTHSEDNFAHKYYLVEAECALIQGEELQAHDDYDRAIKAAERSHFIQYAAIANERAAHLWAARGHSEVSTHYLRKAFYYFERWGAKHKLADLQQTHPYLDLEQHRFINSHEGSISHVESTSARGESLDLLTVIKATQAISGEIELDRLVAKMLAIVLENAGAERGFLILKTEQGLIVEAGMSTLQGGQHKEIEEAMPLQQCEQLSRTIVNFVEHSGEHIVLSNALEDARFSQSAYVQKAKPSSLLCIPIIHQSHLCGILYLENNQTTGVFTTHHIRVLQMIASQMAISIENAKLYSQVKASENQYRSLYENAIESIFRISEDGVIGANPALVTLLGYASNDTLMAAKHGQQGCLFVDRAEAAVLLEKLTTDGAIIGYETQIFQKNGSILWVLFSARAHYQADGKMDFYEGSLIDITERRLKEQAERDKEIAELAHQHITSSIQYACRIQRSFLPDQHILESVLDNSFAISEARDIVGGDFIFTQMMADHSLIVATIDCTGHGVPGALMTMIAAAGLKWIIRDERITVPNKILEALNRYIKTTLGQVSQNASSDDGLDGAVCTLSADRTTLLFAGARTPLYCVYQGQVSMFDGDRKSIGYVKSPMDYTFTCHTISIAPGMVFVLCSDGIVDQTGGEKGYGFGHRRLRKLLASFSGQSTPDIGKSLFNAFLDYQGTEKRRDDVTLVGFQV